jgi:hypothetical protein
MPRRKAVIAAAKAALGKTIGGDYPNSIAKSKVGVETSGEPGSRQDTALVLRLIGVIEDRSLVATTRLETGSRGG